MGQGDVDLVLLIPDPQALTRVCAVTYSPSTRVQFLSTGLLVGTAIETGSISVKGTSGCSNVIWTTTATVFDRAPGRPTVTKTVQNNTASATVTQNVGYGVGTREAGIVDFFLTMKSRLGTYCFEDLWEVNASGNPVPLTPIACTAG